MPDACGALTSVASLLARGAERLRQAGVANARREAAQLWSDLQAASSSMPVSALLDRERPAAAEAAAEFDRRIARRACGEPRAYVSGSSGFRHLVLACDQRALIPRPETEGLVELILERVRTGCVADIGTGTGCLALSLAVEGAFRQVVAVDCSAGALQLARLNARAVAGGRAAAAAPVQFLLGDLSRPLVSGALDALVSNPPYLTELEHALLDASVREWEPATALVSGSDGLLATMRLLEDGQRVLRAGGWLALEVDCTRAAETACRAAGLGWQDVAVHNDLFGRERYLLARRSEIS